MKIEWQISEVSFKNNPFELCEASGNTKIICNNNMIFEEMIDLENWFDALIDGYNCLCKNRSCKVDLISEPEPIHFEYYRDKYVIRYKGESLEFFDMAVLRKSLSEAILGLIERLKRINLGKPLKEFRKQIDYLESNTIFDPNKLVC